MALKLYYFEGPGGGELSRLILNYGGIAFEDKRFSREEWPALKATMPFGQVPVLFVGDKPLAQSKAIEFYCAKKAGIVNDEWTEAKSMELIFAIQDLFQAIGKIFGLTGQEKTDFGKAAIADGGAIHLWFHRFEKIAAAHHSSGFLFHEKITVADLALFAVVGMVGCGYFGEGIELRWPEKHFPHLKRHRDHIAKLPGIKAYYERAENKQGPRLYFVPA